MPVNESDTRAKLIGLALHAAGRTEDLICRKDTVGPVYVRGGKARLRCKGWVDC